MSWLVEAGREVVVSHIESCRVAVVGRESYRNNKGREAIAVMLLRVYTTSRRMGWQGRGRGGRGRGGNLREGRGEEGKGAMREGSTGVMKVSVGRQ